MLLRSLVLAVVVLAPCALGQIDLLASVRDFKTIRYKYGVEYTISINNSIEYVFEYFNIQRTSQSIYPARVTVISENTNRSFPIFVTARQQKGILSWQLPLVVGNEEIHSLSRTLCPNHNYYLDDEDDITQTHPIVHVYTSSMSNVMATVKVDLVEDFYLRSKSNKTLSLSPSQPTIFFYSFENENDDIVTSSKSNYAIRNTRKSPNTDLKSVLLRIDSTNDYCMLISIQNATCPVYDSENDIKFEGFYETISNRGGITVTKRNFPLGFYIVLLVKTNDRDCTGYPSNTTVFPFTNFLEFQPQDFDHPSKPIYPQLNVNARFKEVVIQISPTITSKEYWIGVTVAFTVIMVIYIIFLVAMLVIKYKPMRIDQVDCPDAVSFLQENGLPDQPPAYDNSENNIEDAQPLDTDVVPNRTSINGTVPDTDTPTQSTHRELYLGQLCKATTKAVKRQSKLYLWHVLTIAVFYSLPVIQLVITYQRVLNQSGNHDLCYYNFLCAHPLGYLSDFNHVFSNLGYVMLGCLFIFFVWRRKKRHEDELFDKHFGIPQHEGLYYAMGVSLIMEGVLSASYHVCPNHSNFQFDTTFMYIMAVLCMVKIYQTRHPDVNARAHSTFGILASAVLICMFGVFYPNLYFWIFFTLLHIFFCFFLTIQIYYLGRWRFSDIRQSEYSSIREMLSPTYRSRFVLVLIANLCNIGLAAFGLYQHSKDFASHLLYVFLMNLALHLLFYIVMKLTKGERPPIYTWIIMLSALVTWAGSLYFFFTTNTEWALTPAQSRTFNRPCMVLNFYDAHDIWHMLSACALFFSFMLLLTLDDDISHKLRDTIHAF